MKDYCYEVKRLEEYLEKCVYGNVTVLINPYLFNCKIIIRHNSIEYNKIVGLDEIVGDKRLLTAKVILEEYRYAILEAYLKRW